MSTALRVIFMGTPNFSCPTLEKLLEEKSFEVVGVYTREPQIAGRGHKVTNSPIHELALKNNLKVFTPKTLRNKEVQEEFFSLNADVAVVVAYGLILPKEILNNPKFGCLNIHPSILPKWRGATPIQQPILNLEKETGVAIIKMDEGLDSGDIIDMETFPLLGHETYLYLAEKMSELGAQNLVKTLKNLLSNNFKLTAQNHSESTYAKKIEKTDLEIDWNFSAQEIEAKIRALRGCGDAFFNYNSEKIKIFSAKIIEHEKSDPNSIGKIINSDFHIQCKKGIIQPEILQRPGKKPLPLSEFLRGFIF